MAELHASRAVGVRPFLRADVAAEQAPGVAWLMVIGAVALLAAKPLLDIPGEKTASDNIDLGMLATVLGALLMIGSLVVVSAASLRLPLQAVIGPAAILGMLLLSLVNMVAAADRSDLFAIFALPRPELFGPYVPPARGMMTEAARLLVTFAPVFLLATFLVRRSWVPERYVRWTVTVFTLGAIVHCAIAWLQFAGVVPYTFFFELPGKSIGRASGAYFHPASLGILLIFGTFALYASGGGWLHKPLLRYPLLLTFLATAAITMHRMTILTLLALILLFGTWHVVGVIRSLRIRPFAVLLAVPVSLVLAGVVGFVAVRWGRLLWDSAAFLLTHVGSLDIESGDFLRGRGMIWSDLAAVWSRATADIWLVGVGYEPWNTHNDLIRVGVIWGIAGILLMAALFTNLWLSTWRRVDANGRWALICLYVMLGIFGSTQKPTAYPYFVWLFLFSHMMLIALHARERPARSH
jgi:hypothetical protein